MKGRIVRDRPPVNIHPLNGDRPFLSFSIRGRVRSLFSSISLDGDSHPLGYWPGYSGALSMRVEFLTALSRVSRNSKESGGWRGRVEEVSGSISKSAT